MSAPLLPPLRSETRTADSLVCAFHVAADLPFFEGHFPGHPILPGVVALGWLLAAAERFLQRPLGPVELLNVKFQVVILPDSDVEIAITRKAPGRLQAVLSSSAGAHASALIPG